MGSLSNPFREVERESFIPDDKRKKVGNYLLGPTLGDGNFGKVRLGTHVLAREKVAVKILTKKAILLRDYLKKNLRREAMMLQKLSHPNIVHLYEVMETENSYYMVLELAGGRSFVSYLSERNRLDETEAKGFMRQLVSAVNHIHQSGIVHRDLKLDNILLDEERNIKLIDFGLSNFCQEGDCLMTQCGSPAFTAPEVLSQKKYGPAVDVWTLGVDLYVMLTGNIPFEANRPSNLSRLYAAMLRGCSIPERLSAECQDLLRRMLNPMDTSRITVTELCTNMWITEQNVNPVVIVPPRKIEQQRDISKDVVCYMLKTVKTSDRELTLALRSVRASSLAAMHDLLKKRLERGLGFPRRNIEENTEERSCDNGPGVLNKSIQICGSTPDELIEIHKQSMCKNCTEEESKHSGKMLEKGVCNYPQGITRSSKACYKCGKTTDTDDSPDSVLNQVLQFQKLLPMFQEIPFAPLSERDRIRKGSECSDMVSLLNSVDEETFERALRLLRGYSSLPDPPTPPNSAFNGQDQDPSGIILADIKEEHAVDLTPNAVFTDGYVTETISGNGQMSHSLRQRLSHDASVGSAVFDYKDGPLFSPKQLFSLTSGEVKLTYRLPKKSHSQNGSKKPGIHTHLNVLPPIELNSGPQLSTSIRKSFEPREHQPLTKQTYLKPVKKVTDKSPRQSTHENMDADTNIWQSSSSKPSSRQELPAVQSRLRHSIGGGEQFGLKYIPRRFRSKDDFVVSRKTTR